MVTNKIFLLQQVTTPGISGGSTPAFSTVTGSISEYAKAQNPNASVWAK